MKPAPSPIDLGTPVPKPGAEASSRPVRANASPLSADQIASKRFRPALRGWDRQQVHTFLMEVAALVEANAASSPSSSGRSTTDQVGIDWLVGHRGSA